MPLDEGGGTVLGEVQRDLRRGALDLGELLEKWFRPVGQLGHIVKAHERGLSPRLSYLPRYSLGRADAIM